MEFKSNNGVIYFHETPWNDNSFKGKSLEIEYIESKNNNSINLLSEFCSIKAKQSYTLIASRIPASNIELKKNYILNGFIIVEHTLNVSSFGIDLNKVNDLKNKYQVEIEKYKHEYLKDVEDLASEIFKFGRFYEDPFIDQIISLNRSRFWISDLISQKATIKVLKKKTNVVGFMAYKINNNRVNLLLCGVKDNYRHLAYGFLASILSELESVEEIHSLISSSNIDVLNLFAYFGFRFEKAQFGFHKHLSNL